MQTEVVYYSRVKAHRAGVKRYFGAVCQKHPERNGERLSSNGNCLGCNKDKMRLRRSENPNYHRVRSRLAYEKWRDKNIETIRAKSRMRRTGVDAETYKRLVEIQGGRCPLCSRQLDGNRPHADHCHNEKKPRGVLCATCNQLEGMVKRTGIPPEELGRRLAEYLAHPPAERL